MSIVPELIMFEDATQYIAGITPFLEMNEADHRARLLRSPSTSKTRARPPG
jgi:hypothetical protein